MIKDPIVIQVRQAGAELAKEACNDMHTFFNNMKLSQEKYKYRLVSKTNVSKVAESPVAYRPSKTM